MLARLQGVVIDRDADGVCTIDVSGVGYEVAVPQNLAQALPQPPESTVLFIHTHVREDAITLFGFRDPDDRRVFRSLLGVSGIGPKLALSILGRISAHNLALAITRADKSALKGISGVGPKIIERMFLDLKDKLPIGTGSVTLSDAAPGMMAAPAAADPLSQVARLLVGMGYKPLQAEQAIAQLAENVEGKSIEMLLRDALSSMR